MSSIREVSGADPTPNILTAPTKKNLTNPVTRQALPGPPGTIAYEPTEKVMYYADGTTWKTFAIGGPDLYVNTTGDTMSGPLSMGGNRVTNGGNPIDSGDFTTKGYVDNLFSNVIH
jgi:hypothetical protein